MCTVPVGGVGGAVAGGDEVSGEPMDTLIRAVDWRCVITLSALGMVHVCVRVCVRTWSAIGETIVYIKTMKTI